MSWEALIAVPGVILLGRRWFSGKSRESAESTLPRAVWPKVSIVVPARNEARNLPRLLGSLARLDYPDCEIVVLDDLSTDETAEIAQAFPRVKVIRGAERPLGWKGKQWACHQGRQAASGEILLFTDADTVHRPDSLKRAVDRLLAVKSDMLSCLPFHECRSWWERLSGPFHVLLLTPTAPYSVPRPRRVYAIGQYLMLTASAYERLGGHEAVRDDLVEDLPMANHCLANGLRYVVFADREPLFSVRMYAGLGDFISGWRRNFRAGLKGSNPLAVLEVTAVIAALTGAGHLGTGPGVLAMICAMMLVSTAQRRLGEFSPLGVLLFPFSVFLFCGVTALAVFDMATSRPMVWKGRSYANS